MKINRRLRTNLEATQVKTCLTGALFYAVLAWFIPPIMEGLAVLGFLLFALAITRFPSMCKHLRFERRMLGNDRKSYRYRKYLKVITGQLYQGNVCIGEGFEWQSEHCQKVHEFFRCDMSDFYRDALMRSKLIELFLLKQSKLLLHPIQSLREIRSIRYQASAAEGYPWVHALDKSMPMFISENDLLLHSLVVGTTGAGKTSLLNTLVAQVIAKNWCVLVIDPKGDKGLFEGVRAFSQLKDRRFVFFSLANLKDSIGLNLMANFGTGAELATRIVSVLPGGGESEPFRKMSESAARAVIGGLELMGNMPTLEQIYLNLQDRRNFAVRVLRFYLLEKQGKKESDLPKFRTIEDAFDALSSLYQAEDCQKNAAVTNVIDLATKSEEILDKTISSLKDLLAQLTRSDLSKKLSPSINNDGMFTNSRQLIEQNAVFYLGTDALRDSSLAQTLGSLFLTDLAAATGDIYNYRSQRTKKSYPRILVVVDEASDNCCDALIALLSKARGAGMGLVLATQGIVDFTARLGTEAKMLRVLGNTTTRFVMRVGEHASSDFFSDKGAKTSIFTRARSHTVSTTSQSLMLQGRNLGERETEVPNVPLIDSQLLKSLPKGEAFVMNSAGHVAKIRVPFLRGN